MALRPLDPILEVAVDEEYAIHVTEAGRDSRNGLTVAAAFVHGDETIGAQRITLMLSEARAAVAASWTQNGNGHLESPIAAALLGAIPMTERLLRKLEGTAGSARAEKSSAQGRKIEFPNVEPWPDPVEGSALLDDLGQLFTRYLVLPAGATVILALWVIHSYLIDAFDYTGYLGISSATRQCGKTTTIQILFTLVHRALSAGNVSASSLFRVVQDVRPTMLLDELDRLPRDHDIWQLLNDGFRKTGGVVRNVGENHEPRFFSTWAAKALGFIRKPNTVIPETVTDRTIFVHLSRKKKSEKRERLRSRRLAAEAEPLRSRVMRWAADHKDAVTAARPDLPEELNDREADCWEPLLAIADTIGGEWPQAARAVAVGQSADRALDEADDAGVLVLLDLLDLLDGEKLVSEEVLDKGVMVAALAGQDMVKALVALPERPWAAWGKQSDGLTTHSLARLLKPHGLRSEHLGASRGRRYQTKTVRDAAERFQTKCSSVQAPESAPVSPDGSTAEHLNTYEAFKGKARGGSARAETFTDPADCPICGRDSCPGNCRSAPEAPKAGEDGWELI